MKLVGFKKEQDSKIINSVFIVEQNILNDMELSELDKNNVIDYLENGKMIFSITLSVFDNGENIGPYMILTDGEWMWPSHFSYYLKKYNYLNLDKEFFSYLKNKNFTLNPIELINERDVTVFLEQTVLNIRPHKK